MDDDARLKALFADEAAVDDDGFSARVMALAALEDRLSARRRAAITRIGVEAVALGAVVVAFAFLARLSPATDVVAPASPAMAGLLLLAGWLAFGPRATARGG